MIKSIALLATLGSLALAAGCAIDDTTTESATTSTAATTDVPAEATAPTDKTRVVVPLELLGAAPAAQASRMAPRDPLGAHQPVGQKVEASSFDYYFHPNDGAHAGWVEPYHMCSTGGDTYMICNGTAPVRYWNPSSCGGTITAYYAYGTRGWSQTAGGCS